MRRLSNSKGFCSAGRMLVLLLAAVPTAVASAAVLDGDTADRERNKDESLQSNAGGGTIRAGGSTSSGNGRNGLFMFDLTAFSGQTFTSADLRLTMSTVSGSPTFNVDLYGVGYGTVASTFPAASDYYDGAYNGDTTNTTGLAAIQDNFLLATPTPTAGSHYSTNTAGDTALLAFLNARPLGEDIVFFRIVPDSVITASAAIGYNFHSANSATQEFRPKLGLNEPVPEPGAAAVLGMVGLGALARRRNRKACL